MPVSKKVKVTLWVIVGVVILVPILIVLVVLLRLGTFIRMGVEVGGPRAVGVETHLRDATVSVLGGKIDLEGLSVGNPAGYKNPTLMRAERIFVHANLLALRKKEVHLREVNLAGPEFTYEYANGKSNIAALQEKLQGASKDKEETKKEEGEPVKIKIDLLKITDAKVHVTLLNQTMDVSLPSIEMRDIADKDGNAIPPDQIVSAVLGKIVAPIEDTVGTAAKQVKDIGGKLGQSASDAGKTVSDTGKQVGGEVKKLFGN